MSTHVCGRVLAQLLDAVAMVTAWSTLFFFFKPDRPSPHRGDREAEMNRTTRKEDERPKDEAARETE